MPRNHLVNFYEISTLIEALSLLGFPVATNRTLFFNVCLGQKSFVIGEHMRFGRDTVNYQIYFKEDTASKRLTCSYYDTTLRKAVAVSSSIVNGIDVMDLEKRMGEIDWKLPVDHYSLNELDIADKNTWKQEAAVEAVTRDLEVLGSTAEGAGLANMLKYKFWTDLTLQGIIPELPALKSRYELSQRFYIINGDGITASEAYRFLNNRWTERSIHANNRLLRKKEPEQRKIKAVTKGTSDRTRNRHSKEIVGK
ncbi:hypothetical protein FC093_00005 [Ilyomonas limi]|uniref:Uncharacterized protein n=1 Tax=Ilyomonas limi TaxID=2575867 RepID=A0A4U3LA16_9BACT|nr:hypothetical protein [Ilyomonas limi]TKK71449.1 hypothetical protein FC093_00005 [Ilyomonas limi]